MNRKSKLAIFILVVFAVMLAFPVVAFGDMGGFAGSSDFGSFDIGGGGGSFDYDGGSSYDSGGYYGGGGIFIGDGTVFLIIIVIIVVLSIISSIRARKRASANPGAKLEDISTLKPVSEYLEIDPGFNEEKFKEKIADWYVNMQHAWTNKDMAPVQPYFTDVLYSQFESQMKEYIARRQTNKVENIAVLDVELRGWKQDEEKDSMFALVKTRITDYVVDDATGNVLRGSSNNELFMAYEWTLVRSKGMKTPEAGSSGAVVISCPHCGAPININQSAKCEYCGNIVQQKEYDWVVSAIKGVAQRTGKK